MKHTKRLISASLIGGLTLGGIAAAQNFESKPIFASQPIAMVNQNANVKLHRVVDEELGVACYVFSDGRTGPSCVNLRQGAR